MVVVVFSGAPLGCHACMPHNDLSILRDTEAYPMAGKRPLIDGELSMTVICDSGCVGSSGLTYCCQNRSHTGFLLCGQAVAVVNDSK